MSGAPSFEALLNRPRMAWMGQNTTHLEPPPEVSEALLASTRSREFQLYAPGLGFEELRALVVEDLGLPGFDAWVTDGAVGGLHHICTALAPVDLAADHLRSGLALAGAVRRPGGRPAPARCRSTRPSWATSCRPTRSPR